MPSFAYRGRNGAGDLVQGALDGATPNVVADTLRMAME